MVKLWFSRQFQPISPYYRLLVAFFSVTGTSKFDKIYSFAHSSDTSNITRDLSVKMILEMSIFMYFLAQFWCFKIFALVGDGCQGDFLHIPIQVFNTFYPSWIPAFFKDLSAGQNIIWHEEGMMNERIIILLFIKIFLFISIEKGSKLW